MSSFPYKPGMVTSKYPNPPLPQVLYPSATMNTFEILVSSERSKSSLRKLWRGNRWLVADTLLGTCRLADDWSTDWLVGRFDYRRLSECVADWLIGWLARLGLDLVVVACCITIPPQQQRRMIVRPTKYEGVRPFARRAMHHFFFFLPQPQVRVSLFFRNLQGRISWGIHGLPKAKLRLGLPYNLTPSGQPTLKRPYGHFRGGRFPPCRTGLEISTPDGQTATKLQNRGCHRNRNSIGKQHGQHS
jgi:hypothetical protein